MTWVERFLAVVSKRMVWAGPGGTVRYEVWAAGRQGRVVVEIEAGWFGGTLIDADAELPFSAPLAAFIGESVEVLRTPSAPWVKWLPRGIRRGDTITLWFRHFDLRLSLLVEDFTCVNHDLRPPGGGNG